MTKKSLPVLFLDRFKDFLKLDDVEKASIDLSAFYLKALTDPKQLVSVYKDKKFVPTHSFHFVKDLHGILWREYQGFCVNTMSESQKDFMFFEFFRTVSFYFESFFC